VITDEELRRIATTLAAAIDAGVAAATTATSPAG
jgi:hypothetical protein